jgi:hypothetical protein
MHLTERQEGLVVQLRDSIFPLYCRLFRALQVAAGCCRGMPARKYGVQN